MASQRQTANKSIADYMLSNGYNEALECFKREADFPGEMDPEVGLEELRMGDGKNPEQPNPPNAGRRPIPWFLLTMSIVEFCIHVYMVVTEENRMESPLILDSNKYVIFRCDHLFITV